MNAHVEAFDIHELKEAIKQQMAERGWGLATHKCHTEEGHKMICAFTVGLCKKELPELVVFGPERAEEWLAHLCGSIANHSCSTGQPLLGTMPCRDKDGSSFLVACGPVSVEGIDFLSIVSELTGRNDFEVYQAMWSDKEGHFPCNDDGYDEEANPQFLLPPAENVDEVIAKYMVRALANNQKQNQ